MSSIPLLTFLKTFTCSEIPVRKYPVRPDKTDDSSRAVRAELTISLARQTALIDDRERFEARRWDTSVSREMSLCTMELDCEADGESEAWLWVKGEVDILAVYGRRIDVCYITVGFDAS